MKMRIGIGMPTQKSGRERFNYLPYLYFIHLLIQLIMIQDFSKVNSRPDHVVCNKCGKEMYVDCDVNVCPCCGEEGYLMDIEQEVEIN